MQKSARFVGKDETAAFLPILRQLRMLVAVLYAKGAYLALLVGRERPWVWIDPKPFILVVRL